jgi:hypothetical protein
MSLVQISERTIRLDRVPIGERPVFEIELEPNQEIVAFRAGVGWGTAGRKTEDHYASVWVATRLDAPDDRMEADDAR